MAFMSREWLNIFIDQGSTAPSSQWVKLSEIAVLNTPTLLIIESDRSGTVVITHNGLIPTAIRRCISRSTTRTAGRVILPCRHAISGIGERALRVRV